MHAFKFRFKAGTFGNTENDIVAATNYAHLVLCCIILCRHRQQQQQQQGGTPQSHSLTAADVLQVYKRALRHRAIIIDPATSTSSVNNEGLHKKRKSNSSIARPKYKRGNKWLKQKIVEDVKKISKNLSKDIMNNTDYLEFLTTIRYPNRANDHQKPKNNDG